MNPQTRTIGVLLILVAWYVARFGVPDLPGPGPAPSPAPIPEPGLHVLVVTETASLTPALAAVLNSPQWQSLVPAGNWRVLDPDTDMSRDLPKWRNAMARPRSTLPWVIVSNSPHGGYEGPLHVDQLVALVQQWKARG